MKSALLIVVMGAALSTGSLGQIQSIELRSGEVVIGRVTNVSDRDVTIESNSLDPTTRSVARSDLAPLSHYTIMAARSDAADAKAHAKLAVFAREIGLPAQAIAEYAEAARLDPTLKPQMDAGTREVRNGLAADLLDDAKDAVGDGRLAAARLLLHTIGSKYSDTPAARDAQALVVEIAAKEASAHPGTKVIASKDLEAAMKKAAEHLQSAERVGGEPSPHGGLRAQRRIENQIVQLESAWKVIKDLAGATGDTELTDRFQKQRESIRQTLVNAYLAIGTLFVERRALPNADEYCEKACELDPENKDNHTLHRLILDAKISRGYGKARTR